MKKSNGDMQVHVTYGFNYHSSIREYLIKSLCPGDITVLYGATGVGKSSLAKSIIKDGSNLTVSLSVINNGAKSAFLISSGRNEICFELEGKTIKCSDFWVKILPALRKQVSPVIIIVDDANSLGKNIAAFVNTFSQITKSISVDVSLLLVGNQELKKNNELKKLSLLWIPMPTLSLTECRDYIRSQLPTDDKERDFCRSCFVWRVLRATKGNLHVINRLIRHIQQIRLKSETEILPAPYEGVLLREIAGQKRRWKGAVALITTYTLLIGGLGWLMFGVLTLPLPAPAWLKVASAPVIEEQRPNIADEVTHPRNAMQSLFSVWGYDVASNDAWCNQALRADLVCAKGAATLDELIKQGLPWIAELQTERGALHAVVIRAGKDSLDLLINQDLWTVKRSWFEAHWHQGYTLFWKAGPNGISTINSKSKPEDILWLDSMLSKILNLPSVETTEWKPMLVEKIKLFQKQQKLQADGIVGKTTFIHMWQEVGGMPTLLTDKSSPQLVTQPKVAVQAPPTLESEKK